MVIIITSISVPKSLITTSTRCRSTKLDGEFIILDSTFPLESFISGTDWKIWIDWTNDRSSGILLLFKYRVTAQFYIDESCYSIDASLTRVLLTKEVKLCLTIEETFFLVYLPWIHGSRVWLVYYAMDTSQFASLFLQH